MSKSGAFKVKIYDGVTEATAEGFSTEHTVEEVVDYAIEHLGITWPKWSAEEDRGYCIDGSPTKAWANAADEELGERCSEDPDNPSTITLEADGVVG